MFDRFLAAGALCMLSIAAASAQVRIGLMVSATGPTSAIGIPQKNTGALLPATIGNASIEYIQLEDGGGSIHTTAHITGKAASMGEGVVVGVLDALIKDFTRKLGEL